MYVGQAITNDLKFKLRLHFTTYKNTSRVAYQSCCGIFNIEVNSFRPYHCDKKCHWWRQILPTVLHPMHNSATLMGNSNTHFLSFRHFTLSLLFLPNLKSPPFDRPWTALLAVGRRVAALSAKVAEVRITPRSALRSNPAPSPCYLWKVTPFDERQNADVPLVDTCYCNKCCSWHHCLDFSFDRQ